MGLSEMLGKTLVRCQQVYFSGEKDMHEHGVGLLVHKDIASAVLGCRPVSNSLISIRFKAAPSNIIIIQVYASTFAHDE